MTVHRLVSPVMAYPWGSRDTIAALQGRPPSGQCEAELWMGAHPRAPSRLAGGETLDEHIARDPVGALGQADAARFGPRLPYLLKVLAVEQPLSLQLHPDAAQARAGFTREDAAGVDRGADERTYRDPYAKPEMIVALTAFDVLHGLRHPARAADLLGHLVTAGATRLGPVRDRLVTCEATGSVFLELFAWPAADRGSLVSEVAHAASVTGCIDPAVPLIRKLARDYPTDPGTVAVALLNHVRLAAGEALFTPPGLIHAYLHGTAVEILGNSDNVVRGGLTGKHVSRRELDAVLDRAPSTPHVLRPRRRGAGQVWAAAAAEFALARIVVREREVVLATCGAQILFCVEGGVEVVDGDGPVPVGSGQSVFVAGGATGVRLRGEGTVFQATPGPEPGEG